jgi:hypothetical protein
VSDHFRCNVVILTTPTVSATTLASEAPNRLTGVATGLSGQLAQVTDLDTGNSAQTLRFFCPAATTSEDDGNPCSAASDAVTGNEAEGANLNAMALCPPFFGGGSLAADTAAYATDKTAGKLNTFTPPRNPGKPPFRDSSLIKQLICEHDS